MRRRGLAGTVARTAVIAGTATAVSGRVARKQQAGAQQAADAAAYQQQQMAPPPAPVAAAPAPAPAPAGGMTDDAITQLKAMADLHQQGILTDDEFAAQKAKILGL
ncbi:MAG: SHOCT domain-containing protein [Ilumatobacteraceae bacterium]